MLFPVLDRMTSESVAIACRLLDGFHLAYVLVDHSMFLPQYGSYDGLPLHKRVSSRAGGRQMEFVVEVCLDRMAKH